MLEAVQAAEQNLAHEDAVLESCNISTESTENSGYCLFKTFKRMQLALSYSLFLPLFFEETFRRPKGHPLEIFHEGEAMPFANPPKISTKPFNP